jgi:hypothetical protein
VLRAESIDENSPKRNFSVAEKGKDEAKKTKDSETRGIFSSQRQ